MRTRLTILLLFVALLAVPGLALAHDSAPGASASKSVRGHGDTLNADLVTQSGPPQEATARARKAHLIGLMDADDAGEVLRLTLPDTARAKLPAHIRPDVEERVDVAGEMEILHEDSIDPATGRESGRYHYHLLTTDKRKVVLHFAGAPPDHVVTGSKVRVKGVALDHHLAVDGKQSVTPTTRALTAPLANTFGPQKALVILVNFVDLVTTTDSVANIKAIGFAQTNTFFLANSYGQTTLTGDVIGWFTIALSSTVCDYSTLATQALAAASAAGFNPANYPRHVFNFPANACGWLGLGTVGGNPSRAWIKGGFGLRTVAHELGHNLGLWHSHSLDCGAEVTCTTGAMSEYGDVFDMMGGSGTQAGHYTAYQKERLGWLNAGASPPLTTVTASGTYRIDPYETATPAPKALKIPKGTNAAGQPVYYYLEARKEFTANPYALGGVLLHSGVPLSPQVSYLLDATPETASWSDAPLALGRTYVDAAAGVSLLPTQVDATGAVVTVTIGSAPPPPPPPPPPPTALSSVSVPATVIGTTPPTIATGLVQLSGLATSGGVTVMLTSSNPTVVSVPASVAIGVGLASATFPMTVSAVTASQSVVITAALSGTSRVATVLVTPPGVVDTTPPTVTITSPAGSTVKRGSTTTLSATATDASGIASVTFTVNGVAPPGCVDTVAPYACAWQVPPSANKSYSISVIAKDKAVPPNVKVLSKTVSAVR